MKCNLEYQAMQPCRWAKTEVIKARDEKVVKEERRWEIKARSVAGPRRGREAERGGRFRGDEEGQRDEAVSFQGDLSVRVKRWRKRRCET